MTWLPETAPGNDPFERVFGLRPNLFEAWKGFEALLWENDRVDPVVLELCRLRLAGMNGAPFCLAERTRAAAKAGLGEAKIAALDSWWKTDLFSDTEVACLRFAEQFALDPGEISDGVAAPVVEDPNAGVKRLAHGSEIERLVTRKIGDTEPAPHIELGKHLADFLGKSCCQIQDITLRFYNRFCAQGLAPGEDMQPPPLGSFGNDRAGQCRNTLCIDAELLCAATHFHSRTAHLEIGIHPDRDPGRATDALTDCKRALRLALGLAI